MAVSRRVIYRWRCGHCGSTQEAPVWRIVDSRERNDVVERAGPELAEVTCSECGCPTEINEPLLVIRPAAQLPLLLGLPLLQLAIPSRRAASLPRKQCTPLAAPGISQAR